METVSHSSLASTVIPISPSSPSSLASTIVPSSSLKFSYSSECSFETDKIIHCKDHTNIICINVKQDPEFELDSPNFKLKEVEENYCLEKLDKEDYFLNLPKITNGPVTFVRSIDCKNSITSCSISAIEESFPNYSYEETAELNIINDDNRDVSDSDVDDDHETFKEVTEYNVESLTCKVSNEKYISYSNHQLLQQLDLVEARRRKV